MLEFKGVMNNEGKSDAVVVTAAQEISQQEQQNRQSEQQVKGRGQKQSNPYRRSPSQPPTKDVRDRREANQKADTLKAELSAIAEAQSPSPTPEELEKKQWKEWEEGLRHVIPGKTKTEDEPGWSWADPHLGNGLSEPWRPGKQTVWHSGIHEFIDTPQEKERIRAQIPPEEVKQLQEIMNKAPYELSNKEWELLDSRPRLVRNFMNSLDSKEEIKWGHKLEQIGRERINRAQAAFNRIFENAKDNYPSWWEVYDKDGKRIWKMSLGDKALLAEWRRFDSLSPQEQVAELKEWAKTHIQQEDTTGEKVAKAIEAVFALIFALIAPYGYDGEERDKPAH